MAKETKRITALLNSDQRRELEILMEEDGQTNITFYIVYLIMQEKKRRAGDFETPKRPVGRPKKVVEEEDKNLYPAPYKGGGAYTKTELEAWYAFDPKRGEMPPLPKPLTAKEIEKYN